MRCIALLVTVAAVGLLASPPAQAAHVLRIQLHTHVDFTGHTGSVVGSGSPARATGTVVVWARRGHGPWYVVMRTSTDAAGRYRARFQPTRRGTYTVRLATPDRASTIYIIHVF
jgi:hypothetical protein